MAARTKYASSVQRKGSPTGALSPCSRQATGRTAGDRMDM
jgi:hypothetical protein